MRERASSFVCLPLQPCSRPAHRDGRNVSNGQHCILSHFRIHMPPPTGVKSASVLIILSSCSNYISILYNFAVVRFLDSLIVYNDHSHPLILDRF
ncbi:hypothetical protein CY34DRAFT_633575 [Suillus luteus UH-Slu-Lm8-n1]|uniref:Uncharacterized protein n=1 Tax=Suillus luteus UH-Slu-Lm8-n1 TaxID=930992 RepID=A0A0D0ARP3_9AGAM|nr:hypothetical protein CY34DRAFT_633575 [Suillus luteus UH-Slu-Lm8-n1]